MDRTRTLLGTLFLIMPLSTNAAEVIGNTVAVIPAAFSEAEGGRETLSLGADVVRDAFVRTDKGGSTTLRFKDDSELQVGPRSRVKLDRFVYADEKTFSNAGVMMLKGSFRWTTGLSPKPAYDLRTPTASIGIRGTILQIEVTDDVTLIKVIEGAIRACASESTDCLDAGPETGTVRVSKTSATIDTGKPQRRAEIEPQKKKSAAAKPKVKQAKAKEARPNRVRQARLAKPRVQRLRIGQVVSRERVILRRRAAQQDPGFAISIGIDLIGGLSQRPRMRRPAPSYYPQ